MKIKKGDKAPNFTLRATDLSEISLNNFRGKNVVILFFPLAFTELCTKELCIARDNLSDYQTLDAEIIAISVDSLFTLRQFKEVNNYNFLLLSDFNKIACRAYDSFYEDFVLEMKGVSKRSAFVIDKDGIIRYVEILKSIDDLPNFQTINETLKTLENVTI